MRKIEESKKSPMSSKDFANYMRRNLEMAKAMEAASKQNNEGRYSNGTYLVWDVVPRNVLLDADGDMYVVDADIKKLI